jgi:chloride channel 3/4/5
VSKVPCDRLTDQARASNRWSSIRSLTFAVVVRTLLAIVSFGSKVPSGIFVPSMTIGASFGRITGMLLEALHATYPHSRYFAACAPNESCITPGTYAFLGAGAALSGTMHITVSSTVMMFELTGLLLHILPSMIAIGSTGLVSLFFPPGGMADRLIAFNGFPILSAEHSMPDVPVCRAMTPASTLAVLLASGLKLSRVVELLSETSYSGFPIVSDQNLHSPLGYIRRTQLADAINKAMQPHNISKEAICIFWSLNQSTGDKSAPTDTPVLFSNPNAPGAYTLDFTSFADITPLTVHPQSSLVTTKEIFQKMGPRVILVEHKGHFDGLITVKDCIKYELSANAHRLSNGPTDKVDKLDTGFWTRWLVVSANWMVKKLIGGRRNRIVLQAREGDRASNEMIGLLSRASVDSMESFSEVIGI